VKSWLDRRFGQTAEWMNQSFTPPFMVYSSFHLYTFNFKIYRFLLPFMPMSRQFPYVFSGHSVYFSSTSSSFTFSNFYISLCSAPGLSATQLSSSFTKSHGQSPLCSVPMPAPQKPSVPAVHVLCTTHSHILAESNETFSEIF
jgi:hypothetical protein